MTYLVNDARSVPTGLRKLLYVNWALVLLVSAVAGMGFLMLYSVAGGDAGLWMEPQLKRFAAGLCLMLVIAMVPIWFWRAMAVPAYLVSIALLLAVEFYGEVGMGAQRWLDLGFIRLQPSELAKIGLVMLLAAYYDWLPARRVSHPVFVLLPALFIALPMALVLIQPNLGTTILIGATGVTLLFLAGVHWAYFATVIGGIAAAVFAVFETRGTPMQVLEDYQYRRIDTFLNPGSDPLGAGYNITQAQIALGSGGWTGRGFMQGTQSRLNFLPEKHTDFIFNTLAEEFGFLGSITLLALYALIIAFCLVSALTNRDRFASLLTLGLMLNFFFLFALNMAMVMGLAPVVGVPLPLVSYGGSAMLVLLISFGLIQSAHVHKPR